MKVAILGWGSLIWDPRELPHYGPWEKGGPKLNIEFSRISSDGRLTLVIDPKGPEVPTRFAFSPRTNIFDAVEDLRIREGTVRKRIGYLIASTGTNSREKYADQSDVIAVLKKWCKKEKIDACVWTALPSNFNEEIGVDFSPNEAIAYLERIGKSARKRALKYIYNAPPEIKTPVRKKVTEKWPDTAS